MQKKSAWTEVFQQELHHLSKNNQAGEEFYYFRSEKWKLQIHLKGVPLEIVSKIRRLVSINLWSWFKDKEGGGVGRLVVWEWSCGIEAFLWAE